MRVISSTASNEDIHDIETEAKYRKKGETVLELAKKIAIKASRFKHASIVIKGMTTAAIDAVNKAGSVEEITLLSQSLKVDAARELAIL